MHKILKNDLRTLKLLYLCMQLLEQLDFSLTALERIIFLRFLLRYGLNKIQKKDLKTVAEKIDIRLPTLKKTVAVLLEKGVLCDVGDGHFRVSMRFLKLVLATSKARRTYSKFVRPNYKAERPKVAFLLQLLHLLFRIRISHKQKNVHQLLQLNYQQWLVLVNMVWRSDCHGVVFEASTHELANHTGMSRDALLRAITALFQCGLLRSKLNGTLNNNLLKSVSAIYFLNLSHPIWQEHGRYADYYIVRFPSNYQSVCQQAFNSLHMMAEQKKLSIPSNHLTTTIHALVDQLNNQIYAVAPIDLSHELSMHVQSGEHWDQDFLHNLQLALSTFKNHHAKLNTDTDNLQRMNFLFHYYLTQHIKKLGDSMGISAYLNSQMLCWFNRYLKKIHMSEASQDHLKQNKRLDVQEIQRAQEQIRNRILFAITWTIFRYELYPILQHACGNEMLSRRWDEMDIALLGNSRSTQCQIYYSLSRNSDQIKDQFYLIDFHEIQPNDLYKIELSSIDLDIEQQKGYGLLDKQFLDFDLTG